MKKIVVTVACTLIALLAFAQPDSKGTNVRREFGGKVAGEALASANSGRAVSSYFHHLALPVKRISYDSAFTERSRAT